MSGTMPPEPSGPESRKLRPDSTGEGWSSPGENAQGRGQDAALPPATDPGADYARVTAPGAGQIADVGRRVSADLVDFLVLALLGIAAGFVLRQLGFGEVVAPVPQGEFPTRFGFPQALATLTSLAVHLGYWTLMEGRRGQSVGKLAFGIRAVREDASALDYTTALKRHVLFYIPQVFAWVPGLIMVLAAVAQMALLLAGLLTYIADTPLRQGFHDKYAHTLVVKA